MKRQFSVVALLAAVLPLAGHAEDWHADVMTLAQLHATASQAGTAIDLRLEHLHPGLLAEMSEQFAVPVDDLPGLMRKSYVNTTAAVDISEVTLSETSAQFGEIDWGRWGAVPMSLAGTFRETGASIPAACAWFFAYSDGPAWYYEVLATPLTTQLVASAFEELNPVLSALPDATCSD